MRVLFFPLITGGAAIGTISRCLALARELRLAGHEAAFLTNAEGERHVAPEGYPWMKGPLPEPPAAFHPLYDLSDVAIFLNLTRENFLRSTLDSERQAVERFRPDVLFSEFKLTAPVTAALFNLPLVSTACSPADPRFVSPLLDGRKPLDHTPAIAGFNRILDELAMPRIENVAELFFGRSQVKIAPTIPVLEPLLQDVPGLHFVGSLLNDEMELAPLPDGLARQAQGKTIVFAYFGSGEIGPREIAGVIPSAYEGTEFHAVVAIGDHPGLPRLPDPTANTAWFRFVPGRSILSISKVLLFHGGQNTSMAALLHKVPCLAFPGSDFERDFNARALERVGAGLRVPVTDFTPARLLAATRRVCAPAFRRAAVPCRREILRSGGARQAARLLCQAAEAGGTRPPCP